MPRALGGHLVTKAIVTRFERQRAPAFQYLRPSPPSPHSECRAAPRDFHRRGGGGSQLRPVRPGQT
eukprot:7913398-Lingulodinium_polyedra.AAC.1